MKFNLIFSCYTLHPIELLILVDLFVFVFVVPLFLVLYGLMASCKDIHYIDGERSECIPILLFGILKE